MANVHDVAAYVTAHFPRAISTMKLQKLCFIAQGWSLALLEEPLFPEKFQAWARGPVCFDLFDHHRGDYNVDAWRWGDADNLSKRDKVILDGVLGNYEALSGLQLSELTHRDGTPWSRVRAQQKLGPGARSGAIIPEQWITEHYRQLLGLDGAAAG